MDLLKDEDGERYLLRAYVCIDTVLEYGKSMRRRTFTLAWRLALPGSGDKKGV